MSFADKDKQAEQAKPQSVGRKTPAKAPSKAGYGAGRSATHAAEGDEFSAPRAAGHPDADGLPAGARVQPQDQPLSAGIAGVLNSWVDDAMPEGGTVARHQSGAEKEVSPWSIGHYAEMGRSGSRSALPHRERLESSFGQSLGDIPVYQGAAASKAAGALNAEAYAYNGAIVLGDGGSNLRTVAEETAHVLQQRGGGMSNAGPLTDPAGPIETEAASIADTVVAGGQVSGISQGLGASTVARTPTVHKKPATAYPGGAGQSLLGGKGEGSSRQVQGYQKSTTEELLQTKMDPKELDTYRSTVAKKAPDLTGKQATAHAHAQGAVYDDRITQGQTVEQAGNDGATQMSKVLGGDQAIAQTLSGGKYLAAGGSIGYAETTEGRSAHETKQILGLDYNWSGNPFVKDGTDIGKGFNDQPLTYLQFGMTDEMKGAARVSTNDTFQAHVKDLQSQGDALAQFPTFNTQETKANDAYRGTGTTGTGELVDGLDTMNQELTFAKDAGKGDGSEEKVFLPLPDGTKMMHRQDAGEDAVIATLGTDKDSGERNWDYNEELAKSKPEVLMKHASLELEQLTKNATEATEFHAKKAQDHAEVRDQHVQAEAKVKGLEGEVTALKGRVASADDAGKAALESQLKQKEAALQAQRDTVTELKGRVDLQTRLLASVQEKVDSTKGKLAARKPVLDGILAQCQANMKGKGPA